MMKKCYLIFIFIFCLISCVEQIDLAAQEIRPPAQSDTSKVIPELHDIPIQQGIIIADSSQAQLDSLAADSLEDTGFDTTLFYDARIIDTVVDSNRYYLIGDAVVKYQKTTLTAAQIIIDQNKEILIAEGMPDTTYIFNADSTEKEQRIEMIGTPVFSEGSEKLNGDKMIFNYRTKKGRVIHGRTDFESGKYFGEQIKKIEGKTYYVTNGRFSTCDLEDEPHFYFKARRMKIVQNKEIIAKPIVMYISGIPIAYLPFVFFPNKGGRHSGIIIPRYGSSSVEGRYLQGLGYYWAPSDYYDVTAKGNYYDRSGWMADGRFRYKKRYMLDGNIAGSITKKEPIGGSKQNRWDLRIYHNQTISPTMRLRINGTFVSDNSYYRSYSSNIDQRLNRQLNSNATFTKSWPGSKNSLTVNLRHSKYLDSGTETLLLPQISFYHSSRQLFPPSKDKKRRSAVRRRDAVKADDSRWYHSVYYSYNSRLINQTRKDEPDPIARNLNHNSSLSMNGPQKLFGKVGWNQSVSYNETWFDRYKAYYFDADRDSTDTDSVKHQVVNDFASTRNFAYSASANTKIYGMFTPEIGNIVAIRHVVTPNISFSYSPDFTQSAWGNYQDVRNPAGDIVATQYKYFSGSASTGRKTLSFSVRNLFQMKTASIVDGKEKENKIDLFNVNFSSGYNFKADSLRMNQLSSNLSANPTRKISVRLSARNEFYKYDLQANRRVNKFLPLEKKFPRLTYFSASMSFRLEGKKKDGGKSREREFGLDQADDLPPGLDPAYAAGMHSDFYDEGDRFDVEEAFSGVDIPWSASLSMDYSLSRTNPAQSVERFYVRLSQLQIQLTKNWSISYQAQYDVQKKEIVTQSFNFRRNLHCWELTFRWVPTGYYKEFYLRLNVKASQLKDIKVEKRGGRSSVRGYGYN